MAKTNTLIRNYQHDENLRASFNELSRRIFGLSFEDWYKWGYWQDNYIPYSIWDGQRILANVSVSPLSLCYEGQVLRLYQLGTVMTDPAFRGQGLSRRLMEAIDRDFRGADGSFLFANDSVADFYPRFGYGASAEWACVLPGGGAGRPARRISLGDMTERRRFEDAVKSSTPQQQPHMVGPLALVMFHALKFYQEDIYYLEDIDAYAIAQEKSDGWFVHGVFARQIVDLHHIAAVFRSPRGVTLGFSPPESGACRRVRIEAPDETFFIRGNAMRFIEERQLRLPVLIRT